MAWNKHKYGCIGKDHRVYLKEYRIWNTMKQRCQNPKHHMYKHYGGRGIEVCDRWLGKNGFINFYNDMGKRPVDKSGKAYQIDRINVDGPYSPDNCRWVPAINNARNKSTNIFVYIYNEPYCVTEACKMFGVKRTTVTEAIRLRRKTPTDAFADALERSI